MQHVVHVESSRNPFAIGVVGGYLVRQPSNLAEALAAVRYLKEEGYNFSVGIAQVNRYNLAKYGLATYAEAFQVCPNLKAGSRILRECYDRAQEWGKAFSCYYSGNFVTGFEHGYVQKIFASMRKSQSTQVAQVGPIRVIPYGKTSRKRAEDDQLPIGVAADSEAAAKVQTAESGPAMPVPGPGASVPQARTGASRGLANIPTQVVGLNGDPYQTKIVTPPSATPSEAALPLPDLNTAMPASAVSLKVPKKDPGGRSMTARKGGSLLQAPDASRKPENTAGVSVPGATQKGPRQPPAEVDQSFVF